MALNYAAKIALTAVLAWVAILAAKEIYRLWFDRTLVLVPFTYIRNGASVTEAGMSFTQLVSQDLRRLSHIYQRAGQSSGGGGGLIPSTDQVGRGATIQLPEIVDSPLQNVEIEAYGLKLSQLFTFVSRWIEQPHQLVGSVGERSGAFDVYSQLKGPSAVNTSAGTSWYVSQQGSIDTACFDLTCRIYLALLAQQSPHWANVDENDFFVFTRALEKYQKYQTLTASAQDAAQASAALKEAGDLTSVLAVRKSKFVYGYKLAAYILREQGRLPEAHAALTEYLSLLRTHNRPVDSEAEALLTLLKPQPAATDVADAATAVLNRRRLRPLQAGASISSSSPPSTAGTVTCFVVDAKGTKYILSADHVFSDATVGSQIMQPGSLDLGNPSADVVAKLSRVLLEKVDGRIVAAAAMAEVDASQEVVNEVVGIGKIKGIARNISPGMKIKTSGRTSGVKRGVVTAIELDNVAIHSGGTSEPDVYEGMLETSPISEGGDSGAPVLTEDDELIGFVYAGSDTTSIIMPIGPVLHALKVKLID